MSESLLLEPDVFAGAVSYGFGGGVAARGAERAFATRGAGAAAGAGAGSSTMITAGATNAAGIEVVVVTLAGSLRTGGGGSAGAATAAAVDLRLGASSPVARMMAAAVPNTTQTPTSTIEIRAATLEGGRAAIAPLDTLDPPLRTAGTSFAV